MAHATVPDPFVCNAWFDALQPVLDASTKFAAIVVVVLNVWSAVHVTELAAVTKPGFTKLIVTVPVAAVALMLVPEAIAETPVMVPVAPLKEVTPVLASTLPVRLRPVEIDVVPSTPLELKNARVLVTPLTVIFVVVTLPVLFTWKPPAAPIVRSEAGVVVPIPKLPFAKNEKSWVASTPPPFELAPIPKIILLPERLLYEEPLPLHFCPPIYTAGKPLEGLLTLCAPMRASGYVPPAPSLLLPMIWVPP